ncbi:MAG TPA: SDR family oxidoreductase [Phycisphaerae bacterium]|jgi:NAD(P)-dependent dehydrogenase (short-subunit alcohol dehydrogenase family)|nr:SDR family oxidoreductase [Phycisphaerae bacterium]
MTDLRDQVVIITGASSGIGAATAVELVRAGAKVVLGARRHERLVKVAEQCAKAAGNVREERAIVMDCDVSKRSDVDHLTATTVERFGRVDVMIANAGYGMLARIHEMSEDQLNDIFDTNVKGTWYAMQAAARVMLAQTPRQARGKARRGHIIAVSSGAGRRGMPLYGAYAMTKAAQLSLCEAMRVELAREGVYVSSVHPLTTSTEFFDVASTKSRMRSHGVGPAQSAEAVARKIVRLVKHPRPELWPVPFSAYALAFAAAFPRIADWVMAKSIGSRTR